MNAGMKMLVSRTVGGAALILGGLFNQAAAETITYIHTDALGSPVAETDSAGIVIRRTTYEPYGAVIGGSVADGPGYTGHVTDASTGLSYMQQRYMDSQLGVFLSVDPVTAYGGTMAQFNRYRYGNGSPYRFVDPDGRIGCTGTRIQGVCDSGGVAGLRTSARSPVDDKRETGAPRMAISNASSREYKESDSNGEKKQIVNAIGLLPTWKAKSAADRALAAAVESGLPGQHNGKGDAFRHCLWSCDMANTIGQNSAKSVGDIHEAWSSGPRREVLMDLFNNEVGRRYSGSGRTCAAACMSGVGDGSLSTDVEEWGK